MQRDEIYVAQRLGYQEQRLAAERAYESIEFQFLWSVLGQVFLRGFLLTLLLIPVIVLTAGIGALLLPVAWIAPLFFKDNVYGGHWYYTVEDQWHLHESAFSLIAAQLRNKQVPAVVTPRLIASDLAGTPRYYLSIRQQRHVAYVSVLTYGSDLFVSWTMWREERPISVLWHWFKESIQRVIGKGTAFHEIVRYDPARAMRETVHNAVRSGVDAAERGEVATIVGTFGQELAIEPSSGSAPPPVPVAAAAPPATAETPAAPTTVIPPPPVTPPPPSGTATAPPPSSAPIPPPPGAPTDTSA